MTLHLRVTMLAACTVLGCGTPAPPLNPPQQSAQTASAAAARALERGDGKQALTLYSRALAAAESVEDFAAAGTALLNLALLHQGQGELAAAHARLDRILNAPQRHGAALQARAATRKALLYLDSAQPGEALRWADTAQVVCAAPCELGAVLANLRAHVALQSGDAAAAASLAALAQTLAADQSAEQANALRQLGRAQLQLGQFNQASASLAQALAIDQRLGLPERVGLDLLLAGDAELQRGQRGAAREFFERALTVYAAAGASKAAEAVRARLAALN